MNDRETSPYQREGAKEDEDLRLLKAEDVARMLRVAKVTPYQWARKGILPHYRIEGVIRFKLGDIKKFVEAQRVEKKNNAG